ncbi:MAG: WD40/YVTN/BNR-like repeat-containing protein [Chthoniobacterales bacterium]
MTIVRFLFGCLFVFILSADPPPASAGADGLRFEDALRWRNIGPYRGGRTRALCGVPSQPNVFYMAQVNGGVFKSTDFGRTWEPIFDDQPTASVGAIAIPVSNPEVIYVGSGEGLHRPDLSVGDGIYKSIDGGKTWNHLGLRDAQQIAQIAVDPLNPDRLFVAAAGHPYGPNEERGVFRSLDGGATFEKVLYRDENTGAGDVQIDPANPDVVYASLWQSREGPWENSTWDGTNGGIFKSVDAGKTWKQLAGGLPENIVQANLAVTASSPQIVIAAVRTPTGSKLYRSNDAGATWSKTTDDPRPAAGIGGGDLPVVRIDPKNPDVIYSASVVCWKSTDGGRTWDGWRGAPGGDDYQNVWINPANPKIIALGSDQGAIVTVNGGQTWSSWYNQSTAQLYHVTADNTFPYRLYSGQQESGSVGIASRGNDGAITFRDWHPVAAEEYGYVVADPLDPNIVYGGKLSRFDWRTGQAQSILPVAVRSPDFRMIRTQPIIFSPLDPHLLFFSGNTLWQTRDRGDHWQKISPDLTRKSYDLPVSIGKYRDAAAAEAKQRGVIYAVAPSPLDGKRIWCGTDDGLIHLTTDTGKNWRDVTPPALTPWQKISIIDAGHFDSNTAYAAVNTLRLDDVRPHIYRTHDEGKTWTEIVTGIPPGQTVNAVREDPRRKGLLFAGTERGVYVSFDDGENWQPLRLNLPATSVRDLIVKDDDLAIATHGRGFWILDNITPLRQGAEGQRQAVLFKPQPAVRVRWNTNPDTPLPPDEPVGENPPDGAIIDYYLASDSTAPVTLEIKNSKGAVVRRYSSTDAPAQPDPAKLRIPRYWIRPPGILSAQRGLHRFLWDMHPAPLNGTEPEYPIAAVFHNTAPAPTSPWVVPGDYTVVLTADGKTYSQPMIVKMDPRVNMSSAQLQEQADLSQRLVEIRAKLEPIGRDFRLLVEQLEKLKDQRPEPSVLDKVNALTAKLKELGPPNARPDAQLSIHALEAAKALFDNIQGCDAPVTPPMKAGVNEVQNLSGPAIDQWNRTIATELPALNETLRASGLPPIGGAER